MKIKMKKPLELLFLSFSLLGLASCSHTPVQTAPEKTPDPHSALYSDLQKDLLDSSVTIEYVLGRDFFKIYTESSKGGIDMNLSSNKKILERGQMSRRLYPDFFKKASDFAHQLQSISDQPPSCRGPFRITIRRGDKIETGSGCRSQNFSAFSRLVKEAEFLLYSKN